MFGLDKTTYQEQKAARLARETQQILQAALPPQQLFHLKDPEPYLYKKLISQYTNWVYVCASRNASAVASIPLRLYTTSEVKPAVKSMGRSRGVSKQVQKYLESKSHLGPMMGGGEVEEIIVHPWLDLIREVNPFTNGFEMIEQATLFLELTGNAYWHILMGPNGIPSELWTLPSQLMNIRKSTSHGIAYYEFGQNEPLKKLDTEEVVHFKYPNPTDLYYGLGPLEATQLPVSLNTRFQSYESAVLENGAVVPFFLGTEQTLNEDTTTRLRAMIDKIHKGWKKAGKWGMLTGGLKPFSVGSKPKDVNYEAGLKLTKEEICAAFGVPVSMVTSDNVNRSNAEVGDAQYMRNTILPKLKRFEQSINQDIMPLYDSNLFVAFDNPVPNDKVFELASDSTRLKDNTITINEVREGKGEDPVEWGDEPLVQGDWHLLSEVPEPVEPIDQFPDEELDEELDAKGRRVTKVQTLEDGSPTASFSIQAKAEKWLNTTAIVAAGSVDGFLISNETIVINSIPWHDIKTDGMDELRAPLTQTLNAGAERGVTRMRKLRISTNAWDIQNPFAIAWAEKYVDGRLDIINNQTRHAISNAVVESLRQGKNSDELQRVIRQHVGLNDRQSKALINRELKLRAGGASEQIIKGETDLYRQQLIKQRAEMIARTETAAAWAEGNIASYREAGVEYKEFSAANDACPICSPLDGKVYAIGSGEVTIPRHVSCRCDWLPVIDSPVMNEPKVIG
jgi:HK97 family phage portal protein